MRGNEKIIMLMRYVYVCDSFLKSEYLDKLNNYTISNKTYSEETLDFVSCKNSL